MNINAGWKMTGLDTLECLLCISRQSGGIWRKRRQIILSEAGCMLKTNWLSPGQQGSLFTLTCKRAVNYKTQCAAISCLIAFFAGSYNQMPPVKSKGKYIMEAVIAFPSTKTRESRSILNAH